MKMSKTILLDAVYEAIIEPPDDTSDYITAEDYAEKYQTSESHAQKILRNAWKAGKVDRLKMRNNSGYLKYFYKPTGGLKC